MSMTLFTNDAMKLLRTDVDKALAEIAAKHGLAELHLGTISYKPDRLSLTAQLISKVNIAGNEVAQKAADSSNETQSKMLGFNKNIVGEKFTANGLLFEVTEIKLSRPKYPISAKGADNRSYKFTTDIKFHNKEIVLKSY